MPDKVQPNRPRFWWLKRFSLSGLIVIAAILGLRLYWGHAIHQRLEAPLLA